MTVNAHALVVALLVSVTTAGAAAAQRLDPPPGRGRAAAENPGLTPAEVLNMLDAYAIVQAQDTLRLSENQYGDFVTRLKRLQQTRRRNLQARRAILQQLRTLTLPQVVQVDEGAVRAQLKALSEHDERAAGELRKAYAELDEVLDLRQQARFRLFEELLEQRKIDLLKRAQQGAAARQRRE